MRLHSDTLTEQQIRDAVATVEGVTVGGLSQHGSRSRTRSFDLFVTGHGRTGGQWGNTSGLPTASWDDWGQVLAALYALDRDMTLKAYPELADFELVTWGRFPLTDTAAHHSHRWNYDGTVATGRRMFSCPGTRAVGCTARLSLPPVGAR